MRLFVAIVPPPPVIEDLGDFLASRREAEDGPRWTDPGQWHVTLSFMGSVADRHLDGLMERLAHRSGRWPRMRLSIAGGGAFPSPYAARVLFAGVHEGPGEPTVRAAPGVAASPGKAGAPAALPAPAAVPALALPALARSVRNACSGAGAEPDGARFHPHITLARFRQPAEATRWIRVLETYAGPSFDVDEITLISSHLGQGRGGRPRYEELASFRLGR